MRRETIKRIGNTLKVKMAHPYWECPISPLIQVIFTVPIPRGEKATLDKRYTNL